MNLADRNPTPILKSMTPGRLASIACLMEVCAPKPGNVHRGADFEDVGFEDFVLSAEFLGSVIDLYLNRSVGEMILAVVRTTKEHVGTNTNLGLALLLCPLAKAVSRVGHIDAAVVSEVLREFTEMDSIAVYEAIRIASPAGMEPVPQWDVGGPPPTDILAAMGSAADRDMVARQYSEDFNNVFSDVVPALLSGWEKFENMREAIVFAHVKLLAKFGDSLIARKCGVECSQQTQKMAGQAIEELALGRDTYLRSVGELDFWLRADGHRRNPGTTADLIGAGLMVAICNGNLGLRGWDSCESVS